jgi:hypothetical protein
MTENTPTHHTSTSLFAFSDVLEPDQSQSSLEQNSSIEESNIFVSGEMSGHTRFSCSALSGGGGSLSLLGPLEEESPVVTIATATVTQSMGNTNKAGNAGILKPPSYLQQQQQQQQEQDQQPRLTVTTVPGMMNEVSDSMSIGNSHVAPPSNVSHVPPPFYLPSPTLHTSNQTPRVEEKCKHDNNIRVTSDNFVNDNDAERVAAWSIHIALIFFCGLVIASVILTFTVVRDYGFLTLVLAGFIIVFCGFLACFVDNTILSTNPKLRPVRQKILSVVHATRKMLEDEYRLFIHDWNENLLLTQGSSQNNNEAQATTTSNHMDNNNSRILPLPTQERRKKQSKVFKMIKPFLGLKKKLFRGRRRQGQRQGQNSDSGNDATSSSSSNQNPSYKPPPPQPIVADESAPKSTLQYA